MSLDNSVPAMMKRRVITLMPIIEYDSMLLRILLSKGGRSNSL